MKPCDVLCLGAHPDDVEIGMAGTILKLIADGMSVSILDFTHGEMGTRGTVAERDAEAAAAARMLHLSERQNLALPDTGLLFNDANTQLLVAAIREARPRLLFAPLPQDAHPDHVVAAQLIERAVFCAGLINYAPGLGGSHRPRLVLHYFGNTPVEPTLVVDITAQAAKKAEVLHCYRSQLRPTDRDHLIQGLDVLERADVRDRFYGARVACGAAEPFWKNGPLPLHDLGSLMA